LSSVRCSLFFPYYPWYKQRSTNSLQRNMRNIFYIFKKELRSYFYSPIAYVVLFIFLVITGYFFSAIVTFYSMISFQAMQQPAVAANLNITEGVVNPLFSNMAVIILLMMPILTMRLFSEEKRLGTFELLMTYPIRDIEVVLGKFLACVTVFATMLALSLVYPVLIAWVGRPDIKPFISAYIGVFLMGSAFISLGILISTLTENQIIAAVASFGVLLIFWVIGFSAENASPTLGSILRHLSIIEHFQNFAKGLIDTKDLIYYLNFTLFFLFLTLRSLESNRWRG
jgi:ABC-2 type transport system permease protein